MVTSFCSQVSAGEQNNTIFVGAGLSYISSKSLAEESTDEDKLGFSTIELVAGYKFNRFLGVDVRYGSGINDRTVDAAETQTVDSFELSIDGYQSVYFRPEFSNREAKLYALLGYTQLDLAADAFNADGTLFGSSTSSESGSSYGIGAGWFVGDEINVNLEYRMLLDDKDNEFSVVTLGFDYRFHL